MAAPKPVSVRRLEDRVTTLERNIGPAYSSLPPSFAAAMSAPAKAVDGKEIKEALKPSQTVTESLQQIAMRVKRIEEKDKALKQLLDKCVEMEEVLNGDTDMRQLLTSAEVKEQVVLSSADDVSNTAKQLEALQGLLPLMDEGRVPIEGLARFVASLQAQERVTSGIAERAGAIHAELEGLIDSYNEIVNLMSRKLLSYTSSVSRWEEQLDSMAKGR